MLIRSTSASFPKTFTVYDELNQMTLDKSDEEAIRTNLRDHGWDLLKTEYTVCDTLTSVTIEPLDRNGILSTIL